PGAVQRSADVGDGTLYVAAVVIAVAIDEVCVRGEQTDRVAVLDIAAMDDQLDRALAHDFQRPAHRLHAAMSVADNGNPHSSLLILLVSQSNRESSGGF